MAPTTVNPEIMSDSFDSVLRALERSLHVNLIASHQLITCAPDDIASEVFDRPDCKEIDQVPVRNIDKIFGVLERQANADSKVEVCKCMRYLDEKMLVEASCSILDYVHLAAGGPYHLVVNGNAIAGIVTPSDLLRLPVRVVIFTHLTHLEATMAWAIRKLSPGDEWRMYLSSSRLKKLKSEIKKNERKNVSLPTNQVSFMEWYDKRDVLAKMLPQHVLGNNTKFTDDLTKLGKLRDKVMHSNDYLSDAQSLSSLLTCAEDWIKEITKVQQASPEDPAERN